MSSLHGAYSATATVCVPMPTRGLPLPRAQAGPFGGAIARALLLMLVAGLLTAGWQAWLAPPDGGRSSQASRAAVDHGAGRSDPQAAALPQETASLRASD